MAGRLRKFLALSASDRMMFAEALFFVCLAKALVTLLPFRFIARLFRVDEIKEKREVTEDYLHEIKRSLKRTNLISFWKNRCLVSSLAGRMMLRRRKISSSLYLGVRLDEKGRLRAHSWLNSGDFEVVEKGDDYVELFTFS
ncbi:MAG: lasso peptide biosynthesis B2 protein [Bacteroidales bacterium]|nr:lasso peptide biosynthesis B2 protein [Bacteroidales bacterium]